MRQSLFRRHEFYPGLFAERRKPHVNAKGKVQAVKCKAITNVAWGGVSARSSDEGSVMELEWRGWQVQEFLATMQVGGVMEKP